MLPRTDCVQLEERVPSSPLNALSTSQAVCPELQTRTAHSPGFPGLGTPLHAMKGLLSSPQPNLALNQLPVTL